MMTALSCPKIMYCVALIVRVSGRSRVANCKAPDWKGLSIGRGSIIKYTAMCMSSPSQRGRRHDVLLYSGFVPRRSLSGDMRNVTYAHNAPAIS